MNKINIKDIIKNYENKVYDNSRVYTILHRRPSFPTAYYLVILPGPSQKDCYRQAISIGAFRNREMNRAFSKNCYQQDLIQWSNISSIRDEIYHWKRMIQFYENNPVNKPESLEEYILLNSIWEYYEVVQYDYKLKKYKEN